jgi:hypothetical protein
MSDKKNERLESIGESFRNKGGTLYERMFGKETEEEKKARLKEEARKKIEKERRDRFKKHKVEVK